MPSPASSPWIRRYPQRQPRPVRPRQPRMNARPLTQGHRELMAQHQDLSFLPPRLPPRQPSTDTARVTTRKISFKPTSRRSSHASPNQDLPARHRSRDRADGVPQSICPGVAGFRHPHVDGGPGGGRVSDHRAAAEGPDAARGPSLDRTCLAQCLKGRAHRAAQCGQKSGGVVTVHFDGSRSWLSRPNPTSMAPVP